MNFLTESLSNLLKEKKDENKPTRVVDSRLEKVLKESIKKVDTRNIKSEMGKASCYEKALKECLEGQFPDKHWTDITSCNIYSALINSNNDTDAVIHKILVESKVEEPKKANVSKKTKKTLNESKSTSKKSLKEAKFDTLKWPRYAFKFEDGFEIAASDADEAVAMYTDILENRPKEDRPLEEIDKIAQEYYDDNDEFSFNYFTDDELALLWKECCWRGKAYDDEVYEAISNRPNKREIFDKYREETQKLQDEEAKIMYGADKVAGSDFDQTSESIKESADKFYVGYSEMTKPELRKWMKQNPDYKIWCKNGKCRLGMDFDGHYSMEMDPDVVSKLKKDKFFASQIEEESLKEDYVDDEFLSGDKVRYFNDYYEAKKYAEMLGLKESEYGDVYGCSYCYWNESGDRNDIERVVAYYDFVNGKPAKLSKKSAESIKYHTDVDFTESLKEDTVKQGSQWVNKGKEGTHGKFKTKKAADAQRKAMFANGYKDESLEEAHADLSDKTGTISHAIRMSADDWANAKTKEEAVSILTRAIKNECGDSPAVRGFLAKINNRPLYDIIKTATNYWMSGADLSMGRGKKNTDKNFHKRVNPITDSLKEDTGNGNFEVLYTYFDGDADVKKFDNQEEAIEFATTKAKEDGGYAEVREFIFSGKAYKVIKVINRHLEESLRKKRIQKRIQEALSKPNKKVLNESLWSDGEDAYYDIVDRAKSWIDDADEDEELEDCINRAIDDGLIYTQDIVGLAAKYGVINDSDLINEFYEDLFNDIYSAVSDYYEEHMEELKGEQTEEESLKESKTLTEGTSNFFSMYHLPLLVFVDYDYAYDVIEDRVKEQMEDDEAFEYLSEDEYYEKYEELLEKEFDNYEHSLLDEEQYDELKSDVDKHNSEMKQKYYYDKEEDEWSGEEVEIKPGYYEGAQLYVYDKYMGDEELEDTRKFFEEMRDKYGLEELEVAYRFSNGETGYTRKN